MSLKEKTPVSKHTKPKIYPQKMKPLKKIKGKSKKKKTKEKTKKKTLNCDELKNEYKSGKLKNDINNKDFQKLLRCMEKENGDISEEYTHLYPNQYDGKFNEKIVKKKEFYDTKYDAHEGKDYENIEEYTQKICDAIEFELDPHQMFVRNYMSNQTPYNGLLLYHGLGTGKTCSAISVCEETRTYMQQMGISKKIIIVASPAVQENFKIQLFNERKLKKINGLWNIKACIGNKFIKEINPMNMKGLSRVKVVRQIKKLIRQSYTFKGYTEFSNYIMKVMNKTITRDDDENVIKRKQKRTLRAEFSNRMLVIDEVHNIRLSKEGKIKKSSENLSALVTSANNLKLLLLSATPMFDSYTEIIWILNLLNLNDKRYPVELNEVFTGKGDFKEVKDNIEGGEELLVRKARGYISYVRGENPFSFPYRIWPKMAGNNESLFVKQDDGIFKYPQKQLNGREIISPIQLIDLTLTNIGSYQSVAYNKLLHYLKYDKGKKPIISSESDGISFTALEAPLQILNMVYPHAELEDESFDEEMFGYIYGQKGLARTMKYNPKTKREFVYKDATMKKFGRIFSQENIGLYSAKIAYICEKILNSEGIIFVYSQYIDGGAIPIALALEEMGITRYGNTGSLFKKSQVPAMNALTNKPRVAGEKFAAAKYIMITGDKKLTSNIEREMAAVTNTENTNGEKVKVVIVSRAGSEGLDFQNIRQMHILDPWYNLNRSEQVIGRAVRGKSHCALPYNKRNVEIYLYGTLLKDELIEAVDLYIYRLAERKAIKIANVTRILKETATDCLLNRKGLDFSESTIAALAPDNNIVEQLLSSNNRKIQYTLGDKDNSLICDFKRCEYKCKPEIDLLEAEINKDTYNETFIVMNLDKILQRIRNIFKEKYIYKKNELLAEITMFKSYPIDQIYTALTYLIDDENEFITDMLGRLGHLVNIGDYYMFQPVEITDKQISRYERITPITYKRDKITFSLSELSEPIAIDMNGIIKKLKKELSNLKTLEIITKENKNNWSIICAWAIENLVKYNSEKFKFKTKKDCRDEFLMLSMHHIIDILNYEEKILLLRNMKTLHKDIEIYVKSYFDIFAVKSSKYTGVIVANFAKKSKFVILTLKSGEWIYDGASIAGGLGKATMDKFKVEIEKMNNKVGFMAQIKRYDTTFKIKNIKLSSSGRTNKGSACNNSVDKKVLIRSINEIFTLYDGENKYKMGGESKKGSRTIENIYGDDDISQYPYKMDKSSGEQKKILDKKNKIKIKAFQLCIEQELIFRYFDKKKINKKKWFFSLVENIINNIEKVGK
jgi:hypothetical protein|tara:strand:- start:3347 stop:7228 length:3882 start_codon:yes stop_codon:yes gene_type:complete